MPDLPHLPPIPGAAGFVRHADDAPACWMQGIPWVTLADRVATGGRRSVLEPPMPGGAGPPPHRHLWSDEAFRILDGYTPAGHEAMIAEMGQRTGLPTLPPPGPAMPPGRPQMPEALPARHGLMLVDGPNPLRSNGR